MYGRERFLKPVLPAPLTLDHRPGQIKIPFSNLAVWKRYLHYSKAILWHLYAYNETATFSGTTLTVFLLRPKRSKLTWPSILAYSVSSLPIPTFCPGWILVPRCPTITLPAETYWPSPHFTPSILGLDSRPLRELPTPILCAKANHLFYLYISVMPRLFPL